jgi:hypothetical protein
MVTGRASNRPAFTDRALCIRHIRLPIKYSYLTHNILHNLRIVKNSFQNSTVLRAGSVIPGGPNVRGNRELAQVLALA